MFNTFCGEGGRVTAREYFEQARACQRSIDRRLAVIESMRGREQVRAQRYDVLGRGSGSGDARGLTDARLDMERAAERDIAGYARAVCRGVRWANPHTRWGDVLELRFCEDMQWKQVAHSLGITDRQARADVSGALDWIDLVGIAAARDGMGQAALF